MTESKYNNPTCDNKMKFEDCELAILRNAVDESEKIQKQKKVNSEEIINMFSVLEDFIIAKKTILYGGLALNNLMPKDERFYDENTDLPDYDMFSKNALEDAVELANIYYKHGYNEVEAKSGMHYGTFKVFVNFIPIADITQIEKSLFDKLNKESITIAGMKYAPPNYLRMSMYLELSRPAGDVSRWEKILKRLTLLNKYYPVKTPVECQSVDFQRKLETILGENESEKIYFSVRDSLIEQGVVFFGGYASTLYSKYMPENKKRLLQKIPDFDVLSTNPEKCSMILVEKLHEEGFKNIKTVVHPAIGELIPKHIQVNIGIETVAFIFEPIACHSYNVIPLDKRDIKVATIDTMLSFYLAFIYIDNFETIRNRILCMATFLFEVQQENRLNQKGLLKRFTIDCYGKQPTLEDIRLEKSHKYEELKSVKGTKEYNMWFLNYNPGMEKKNEHNKTRKIQNKPKATTKRQTPKIQKMKNKKNIKNDKQSSTFRKREPRLSAFYK